jgi:hypothetical protein
MTGSAHSLVVQRMLLSRSSRIVCRPSKDALRRARQRATRASAQGSKICASLNIPRICMHWRRREVRTHFGEQTSQDKV